MPRALARACRYGCPNDAATCPTHGRQAQAQAYDDRRGTAHARGYGATWRHYTEWFRAELFRLDVTRAGLCGARLPGAPPTHDSECQAKGYVVPGHVVDHIVPVTGPNDPRFYDPTNHQLLCDGRGNGCHDRKRQRERQAVRA